MRGVAVQIKRLKTLKAKAYGADVTCSLPKNTSKSNFLKAECNGGSDKLALSGVCCPWRSVIPASRH